jgi:regulatory protein YycH of two-component signal transduction system YycFG
MTSAQLEKLVSTATTIGSQKVFASTLQGPLPWDGSSTSFSHVFYFPDTRLNMKQLAFQVENINIDNMKQWLFRDPDIRPLIPNADESFYMYNDQLLNYNKKFNFMVYNDSSSIQEEEYPSLPNQLDQIKNFMKRHQGWTGFYLLDEIQKEELYLFRLYKQGYPVYWTPTEPFHNIHPDVIQLQMGDNGVSKYMRSMYYLLGKPTELKAIELPNESELLNRLIARKIPLHSIQRLYPGYVATEMRIQQKKHIVLNPVWIIHQANGKRVFID